jgi:hypothetical protein
MNQEFLKESKNFRRQMGWCSILCWVITAIIIYQYLTDDLMRNKLSENSDWIMIPFSGMILTIIYFSMNSYIKKYEEMYPDNKEK